MSVADDRAARTLARTQFDRPIVLEAGAGTGKTTALVARVVAWLIDAGFDQARSVSGDDDDRAAARALDGLLAITFTEAAAADMDAKIRAALALVESGGTPIGMAEHAFAADATERARRAGLLRARLERPIAQTIHAWCQALLGRHPLEAGLHPGFTVDARGRDVGEIVRTVVTADLRERLGAQLDPDWLLLATRNVGPGSVEQAVTHLVLDGTRAADLGGESFPDDVLVEIEHSLAAAIETFLRVCPAPAVKPDAKRIARAAQICAGSRTVLEQLQASRSTLAEVSAHARAAQQALSKTAADGLEAYANGAWNTTEAKSFGAAAPAVHEAARALHPLWSRFTCLDPELERAARRILARLLERARTELVRQGVETFGDMLRDARDLLERDRELCARLRARLDQILVDEFQDTDPLQCDLVRFIALDPDRGRVPGLLIVGDPKQSIYGFRRADLAAYDRFVDEVLEHGGVRARLTLNFRSGQSILDHVERVVAPHMRREAGVQPEFVGLQAHRADATSRIEWWNASVGAAAAAGTAAPKTSAAVGGRLEARFLAAELRESRARGVEWSEMAVLMRTSTGLDALLEALRDAGVPYDVAGDKSYYRRRETLDAAAVFACVVDPGDHVALLAYLRSPWVGLPDALLIPLWRESFATAAAELDARDPSTLARARAVFERALREMPRDVPRLVDIAGFEAAVDAGLETLAELRASWQRDPADVFLERARLLLLCEAGAAARFQGIHRVTSLERFFGDIALELEAGGGDAHAVLRYLRTAITEASDAADARPRDAAASAVQILTIHKSKGLDFREVFVVGLQRPAHGHGDSRRATRIERGGHVLFGAPSPGWFACAERAAARDAAERVRLLYVAMTRAKDRLVLSGIWPAPRKDATERVPTTLLHFLEKQLPDGARAYFETWTSASPPCELDGVAYRTTAATADDDEHERGASSIDLARVRADSERLSAARPLSRARASHPLVAPMSRRALDAGDEPSEPPLSRARASGVAADTASIAGTSIHRALEILPLAGDVAAAMTRARGSLSDLVARTAADQGVIDERLTREAVTLALRVHDAFVAGPAFEHFQRVAPHVIAREMPLLAKDQDAAASSEDVTLVSGAVDLLYRDPASDELVVVDYKTGAEPDAAAGPDRHRAQVNLYRRSVHAALALDRMPRGELWYLATSRVVQVR